MSITVGNQTLKQTIECTKAFRCLSGESEPMCKASFHHGTDINVVVCAEETPSCYYSTPYGDSFLCLCPTRVELSHRHGI